MTTIIVTLLTAIFSYLLARWQIKRNKIDHLFINTYDIGKGLTSEFPEFSLIYYDEPLSNNVIVLKGRFINNGRNDLDSFNGDSDIQLILPDGCRILKITTSPSTEKLKVEGNRDSENLNIANFGIHEYMMPKEFFDYTVIVEIPYEISNIEEKLKFSQRIKGTEKEIKSSNSYQINVSKIMPLWYYTYMLLFLLSLGLNAMLLKSFPNLDWKSLIIQIVIIGFYIWSFILFFYSMPMILLTKRQQIKKKSNNRNKEK